MSEKKLEWMCVGKTSDLPEGRVKTVTARTTSICLVHFDGQWAAMDNHCPHQGGPLGEGSIEPGVEGKCWIRCPWHGWDFEEFRGRKVVSVSGDGGFGQYAMEFTTAVKYGMDITHVLLNNAELGKISKEQRAGEWPVWETDLHSPSFAAYARLCGGKGMRVTDAAELEGALGEAIAHEGPALVEIVTDAELV